MATRVEHLAKREDASLDLRRTELMELAKETFSRLEHLQNNQNPNHQARIVKALQKAIKQLQTTPEELSKAFLEKYDITAKAGKIRFTIPQNGSVIELLTEAQMISFVTRGSVAVYPPRLANWSQRPEFTKKVASAYACVVEPLVPGSEFKSRREAAAHLKGLGLRIATDWETAAAHAAYTVFNGKPLADFFDGNIVRVKGTKLYYGNGGLSEMDESDYVNSCSYKNVKMAAARNL